MKIKNPFDLLKGEFKDKIVICFRVEDSDLLIHLKMGESGKIISANRRVHKKWITESEGEIIDLEIQNLESQLLAERAKQCQDKEDSDN